MKKILLISIACVGIIALYFLDQWQLRDWKTSKNFELNTLSETSCIRLENSIRSRFNAVSALEALFVVQPQTQPEEFARFSQALLEKNPPVRALQYADSNTRVTYVYPPKGNEITISNPMVLIKDPKRGPYVKKAIETRKPILQGPFPLRQGGLGAVVRNPIFKNDKFIGLAIGVYDVPVLLNEALDNWVRGRVEFSLADANGKVFEGLEHKKENGLVRKVRVLDQTWTMTTWWKKKESPPWKPRFFMWLFGLSALLAMLAAIALSWKYTERLEKTVRERTRDLEEANESLARDMKEIQRMEKQLLHAHRMRSIGTLSGGIAHEFNNLLSIILGNAELAMEDISADMEARLFLGDILAACERGKEVVQQILRFSRKTPSGKKPVDMVPIARRALRLLEETIGKGIEFKDSFPTKGSWVMGDSQEIQQVVLQLVTNAVQALEDEGGTVEVEIYGEEFFVPKAVFGQDLPPGKYVCLEVRDNGKGIAPQDMDRIFEPYFTTRGFGRNLGMGLSVSQGILLGHGGGIVVESVQGQGTFAKCLFPAAEPEKTEDAPDAGTLVGGNERILYVDDEESLLKTIKVRLERLGYAVTVMADAQEALSLFKINPHVFDLVITDLTMPGMKGDQLIQRIHEIRPDIGCILCSGYNDAVSDGFVQEIGASGWLTKPIKGLDLASMVRNVLDGKTQA